MKVWTVIPQILNQFLKKMTHNSRKCLKMMLIILQLCGKGTPPRKVASPLNTNVLRYPLPPEDGMTDIERRGV